MEWHGNDINEFRGLDYFHNLWNESGIAFIYRIEKIFHNLCNESDIAFIYRIEKIFRLIIKENSYLVCL